jgi:hypothetical protein
MIKIQKELQNKPGKKFVSSFKPLKNQYMKANAFENLSLEAKVDELSERGVYLMCRQNSIYNIFLYGIAGIYVEVLYFKKNNRIQNIEVASSDKVIDFYLDEMVLEFS